MSRRMLPVAIAVCILLLPSRVQAIGKSASLETANQERSEHSAALKQARKDAAQRQKQRRAREKVLKQRYHSQPISVIVPEEHSDEAWQRAQIWLAENIRHGIAPIRLVNDTIIQTEKGSTDFQLGVTPEKGVSVTRREGKSGTLIAVRNTLRVDTTSDKFERILARYIQTGNPDCLEALGADFSDMLLCFEDVLSASPGGAS